MENEILTRVLSDKNIFLSIFNLESYIQNKELLSNSDINLLNKLHDPFINNSKFIKKVKNKLINIINGEDSYFQIKVYFKPKKYDEEKGIIFRPLHTASLIDQIAMVSMLQVLVYDIDKDDKLVPSQLSRLIPSNFYGNRISYDGQKLFKPWQEQYHQYISSCNDKMYDCSKNHTYKYEITLDLIDFFPSINPFVLMRFIKSNFPSNLSENDYKVLDKILKKLIFFKLEDLSPQESSWYYHNDKKTMTFVKGIPQGLPHSYFFANLFMILVKQNYEKVFSGEMFFYVDDSVIFTNDGANDIGDDKFKQSIKTLNENLKELNYIDPKLCNLPEEYNFDLTKDSSDFSLKVHNLEDKTSYYKIEDAIEASGELYLHSLSRETSNLGFDIYSSYSSDELITLRNKTKSILAIIKNEIDKGNKEKQYIEKLIRYKKFFSYRHKILQFITNEEGSNLIDEVNYIFDEIKKMEKPEAYKKFFDYYNDGIFLALVNYTLSKYYADKSVTKLLKNIEMLNRLLYGEENSKSYFAKFFSIKRYKKICDNYRYDTLNEKVKFLLKNKVITLKKNKFELIEDFLSKYKEISNALTILNMKYISRYEKYIYKNSSVLDRMILNSVASYLLNYEISDSAVLEKKTNEPILYSEVRILMYLRNNEFNLLYFKQFYKSILKSDYLCQIDCNLLQVLNDFKLFVRNINQIDDLIRIHKYCSDTWKNGSKFLYFYTLHNQEHAVALIKNSIEIIHKISYFNIKPFDFYILFAACYLHDISMVSFPSIEDFFDKNNSEVNKIYTEFVSDVTLSDSIKTKKALYKSYQDIDSYFESIIRRNHAKESANDIRRYSELNFLSDANRELIARVSERHGYDTSDIYWSISKGDSELINEKMVSILLRLSDLLDISRYRVSKIILNHNIKNLSDVSRFHWLSHLITDGYSLKTEYVINPIKNSANKSFLKKESITEKLVLNINVLMSQTTSTRIENKCKYVKTANFSDDVLKYELDSDSVCPIPKCSFLCKWFSIKNEYLIQELAVLKKYLNFVKDNHFNFDVEIVVNPIKKTNISNEEFDYLNKFLNNL